MLAQQMECYIHIPYYIQGREDVIFHLLDSFLGHLPKTISNYHCHRTYNSEPVCIRTSVMNEASSAEDLPVVIAKLMKFQLSSI